MACWGVEAAAALRRHGGEVTLLHRGSGINGAADRRFCRR
ncbi:FAD-dependent oxidoreductase [Klebsiella pneumoniae]|nr:FAD-dependent oxidoreductase [Klebsiella pneumoniae]